MLKHIIGKTLKIGFNVSAIAGIAAAGTITATKLNVVPGSVKQDIAEVVKEYKNPISEAFLDKSSCYVNERNGGRDALINKYKDSEEVKNICLTIEQRRIEEPISSNLSSRAQNIHHSERSSLLNSCVQQSSKSETCQKFDLLDEMSPGSQVIENWLQEWESMRFNGNTAAESIAQYEAWLETVTLEETLERVNSWYKARTESGKLDSDYVYEKTGERLPYYDYVNKVVVYGEEQ